jgi:hypothetical protein
VGAHRKQVAAQRPEVDRHPADGLGGVDVDQHVALPAGGDHRFEVVAGADLVVAPLQVHDRRVVSDGGQQFVGIDPAAPVDADHGHRTLPVGTVPHRRVLDGGQHRATAVVLARRSVAGHGDRLGRPRGEHHLPAAGAEQVGHLLAGHLDGVAGGQCLLVDASRIGVEGEGGRQGVTGGRSQW